MFEATSDAQTASMAWIGASLETIAKSLTVRLGSWQWQLEDGYELVVTGGRDRRTIRVFTGSELEHCMEDIELKSEIELRLTRLVAFVGGKSEESAKKKRPLQKV